MSRVFSAHSVSVDGYISGRKPDGEHTFGRGLGDAPMLFNWYNDGDTQSKIFGGFKLSEPSARFFDMVAARVGAAVVGRVTYEHSGHWGGGSPHPTAPLVLVSHRTAPKIGPKQKLVTSGIEDAIALARDLAGDKDVALMGGGVLASALEAGLVDEVILHQVPILLGGGHSFFRELPKQVNLRLLDAVAAPGVTHLHYEVVR
jgi:dihydrofolate reductase